MPRSLVKIPVHIVFSTKNRRPLIPLEIEAHLFGYIGGIIKNNKARLIVAGGMADHIHVLVSIGRIEVSQLIGDVKRDSSVWMKEHGIRDFYRQNGYGAFSMGQLRCRRYQSTFGH